MNSLFLEQNLRVLRDCKEHTELRALLRDYEQSTPCPPAYHLQETTAGDLTVVQQGVPIHSLQGATQEAQALVEENLLTSQHAINGLLGIGLGYTLQATCQAYQENGVPDTAQLIVYEPDTAFLHYVLSNINLSQYLSHPAVTLLPTAEAFYNFVESHLVAGDGFSFIATPGYLAANTVTLTPVIEKLSKHVVNTMHNATLLGLRGKLWATQFLQNIPHLVKTMPVTALQDSLLGKIGVLCGAGPSLLEDVDTLKAQRENIVVFAVTGAVSSLLKAGITPDFVVFMDFVGPSKHLKNVPKDALKNAQFILGPSAEDCLFEWEHQTSWLGALHFNEQFSYLLDTMYGVELPRFRTGGTVSIFMYQIAFNLGIRDFVIIGQDMALRGNQVYADGTTVAISETTVTLETTEHTVGRCIDLEVVKGWNGEELLTQSDYAHFLYHYTRIPYFMEKDGHSVRLFNASVGGAYIEGWQHAPLATVLNEHLKPLLRPTHLSEIINPIKQSLEKQLPLALMRNRMFAALNKEQKSTERILKAGKLSLKHLKKMIASPMPQWGKQSLLYSNTFNTFSEQLEGHPFLKDTFYGEQLKIYQTYNKKAETEAEHRANMQLDLTYLSSLVDQLQTAILTPLIEVQKALLAQGKIDPIAEESTSDATVASSGFLIGGVLAKTACTTNS